MVYIVVINTGPEEVWHLFRSKEEAMQRYHEAYRNGDDGAYVLECDSFRKIAAF